MFRERFEGSLARPLLPQQRVKMVWRDAADPSKGDWYTGMVVQEAEEWAPLAGSIWEGVSVMWDTDLSKKLPLSGITLLSPCGLSSCPVWLLANLASYSAIKLG